MVITNQSDICAAIEKHGKAKDLPPLPVRTPPPSQAREQNTEEEDQIEEEKMSVIWQASMKMKLIKTTMRQQHIFAR